MNKVEKILGLYTFKNDLGEVISWTPGQKQIVGAILDLGVVVEGIKKNRVQIETPTQYGKSAAVAAGIICRAVQKEKWAIVAGTSDKARIIMSYIINYALDNPVFRNLLTFEGQSIERLRQERNRDALSFSTGFEVRVYSADSRNKQATGNAIMGFGSAFVIEDESALIDDNIESKIVRMLGGYSTTKNLLIKIGNPFYRNHFLKSHGDENYHLIWIDYNQAIKENRFTDKFVEEMRKKPNFKVLYEVKFPDEDAIDERGWMPLLTEGDIERAQVDEISGFGVRSLGVDVAGGGRNKSVIAERYANYAEIIYAENEPDTTILAEQVIGVSKDPFLAAKICIDKVGLGKGCYDILARNIVNVHGINAGLEPMDGDRFVNLRAEMFWRLREWILKGGKLKRNELWEQLTKIKYRIKLEGSKGKLQIMSKDEMFKNGIESPDAADALALTFDLPEQDALIYGEEERENIYDKHALFNNL